MPPKLGIIAGNGVLPGRIIEACKQTGRPFFVVAFKDQTLPETVTDKDIPHAWVRLGAGGQAVKHLRDAGVKELVLAGGIRRPKMSSLRPDVWMARFLTTHTTAMIGDNGLLSALVGVLERDEGFRVISTQSVLPDVLAAAGVYGLHAPDGQALKDIKRGIKAARDLGGKDIGQAAVVEQGRIIAVEGADGTDAMLAWVTRWRRGREPERRYNGGNQPQSAGGVLIKVKKPGQESRADLPTIGVSTVDTATKAGLAGIAIEAGGALVIDREALVKAADAAGLFVIGVPLAEEN
jgi:hypothetical protein